MLVLSVEAMAEAAEVKRVLEVGLCWLTRRPRPEAIELLRPRLDEALAVV